MSACCRRCAVPLGSAASWLLAQAQCCEPCPPAHFASCVGQTGPREAHASRFAVWAGAGPAGRLWRNGWASSAWRRAAQPLCRQGMRGGRATSGSAAHPLCQASGIWRAFSAWKGGACLPAVPRQALHGRLAMCTALPPAQGRGWPRGYGTVHVPLAASGPG